MKDTRRLASFVITLMTLIVFASTAHAETVKLNLENGDWENGFNSWRNKGDNGMSSIVAEAAYEGEFGLKVVDESNSLGSNLRSESISVKGGEIYIFSFMGKPIYGDCVAVYFRYIDAEGELLNSAQLKNQNLLVVKSNKPGWNQYSLSAVAPANAVAADIWIHSFNKGMGAALIDNVEIKAFVR